MYLTRAIVTLDGARHPMVGLIPSEARMCAKLQALGYVEVETQAKTILGGAGSRFRGHQFRYSELSPAPAADAVESVYSLRRRRGGDTHKEGYRTANVLASYVHAHWASNPRIAEAFVESSASVFMSRAPMMLPVLAPDRLRRGDDRLSRAERTSHRLKFRSPVRDVLSWAIVGGGMRVAEGRPGRLVRGPGIPSSAPAGRMRAVSSVIACRRGRARTGLFAVGSAHEPQRRDLFVEASGRKSKASARAASRRSASGGTLCGPETRPGSQGGSGTINLLVHVEDRH